MPRFIHLASSGQCERDQEMREKTNNWLQLSMHTLSAGHWFATNVAMSAFGVSPAQIGDTLYPGTKISISQQTRVAAILAFYPPCFLSNDFNPYHKWPSTVTRLWIIVNYYEFLWIRCFNVGIGYVLCYADNVAYSAFNFMILSQNKCRKIIRICKTGHLSPNTWRSVCQWRLGCLHY